MGQEFDASKPIYLQIIDQLTQEIVRQVLLPGEKLPSVREMAVKMGVNPNTIQRTYSEMERMEIVETKRGQGTFVTEDTALIHRLKLRLQHEMITAFVSNMRELGLSEEEMLASLKEYILRNEGDSDD